MKDLLMVVLGALGAGGLGLFVLKWKTKQAKSEGRKEAVAETAVRVEEAEAVLVKVDAAIEHAAEVKKVEIRNELTAKLSRYPTADEVDAAMREAGLR